MDFDGSLDNGAEYKAINLDLLVGYIFM